MMRYGFQPTLKALAALLTLGMLVSPSANAHTRHYAFTEEYRTLPQGGFEVESATKLKVPSRHATNENTWDFQQELEYGITDQWTVAHYEIFQLQNQIGPDDAANYKGFKFETKYRIGEKGKYWVDPLIYLEWETEVRDKDNPNGLEGKIVLSKDIGKFNVVYNQVIESKLGGGGRTEHNFSVGAGYALLDNVHIGGEFRGNYWHPGDRRNELQLGPTLGVETKWFWLTSGVVFGVNHAADDVEARLIAGVPF